MEKTIAANTPLMVGVGGVGVGGAGVVDAYNHNHNHDHGHDHGHGSQHGCGSAFLRCIAPPIIICTMYLSAIRMLMEMPANDGSLSLPGQYGAFFNLWGDHFRNVWNQPSNPLYWIVPSVTFLLLFPLVFLGRSLYGQHAHAHAHAHAPAPAPALAPAPAHKGARLLECIEKALATGIRLSSAASYFLLLFTFNMSDSFLDFLMWFEHGWLDGLLRLSMIVPALLVVAFQYGRAEPTEGIVKGLLTNGCGGFLKRMGYFLVLGVLSLLTGVGNIPMFGGWGKTPPDTVLRVFLGMCMEMPETNIHAGYWKSDWRNGMGCKLGCQALIGAGGHAVPDFVMLVVQIASVVRNPREWVKWAALLIVMLSVLTEIFLSYPENVVGLANRIEDDGDGDGDGNSHDHGDGHSHGHNHGNDIEGQGGALSHG